MASASAGSGSDRHWLTRVTPGSISSRPSNSAVTSARVRASTEMPCALRTDNPVGEMVSLVATDRARKLPGASGATYLLTEPDRSVAVRGDLGEPDALLKDPVIRGHLDFGRPVAVILLAILHFISDEDDPAGIIATIRDALAPGSYLVISHIVPGRIRDREVPKDVSSSSQRPWPGTRSSPSAAAP